MYTQQDLDNINKALSSGHSEVRLNNRTVKYQSVNQMKLARQIILNDLQQQGIDDGTIKRRPTAYRARTCKGL